jgi:hypothetical protein
LGRPDSEAFLDRLRVPPMKFFATISEGYQEGS